MSEDAAATPNGMAVYRRLLAYAKPYRSWWVLGIIGMLVFATTDVAFIWFIERYLLGALGSPNAKLIWAIPIAVVGLFLVRGVGDYLASYFPGKVGRQIIRQLRQEVFEKHLALPVSYYQRVPMGESLSRLTYATELVAEATTNSLTIMVRDTLTVIGLLAYMFFKSWTLTLCALIVAPLIALIVRQINRSFRRYSARIQQSMGDVTRFAKESFEGHRVIKAFGAEFEQQRRFGELNERNRHSNVRLINAKALSSPVVQLVASLGLAVVLAVAISAIVQGQMRVESLVAFIGAMMMVMTPLRRIANVGGALQQGITAGAGVFRLLDEPGEVAGLGRALSRAQGDIEFQNVSFRYPEASDDSLKGVSFHIKPNQVLAIVGRSGAGKTSLVGLLPRFHDASAGRILLDGRGLADYALSDLRRQMAYVGQEVVLFDDTLFNNIAFGMAVPDAMRVEQAARAAHVLEFAENWPLGLQTQIGEQGGLLSGGQRQRVAIARALYRDAPILILDEATSSLDSESERAIQDALATLMRGRTTLVIAHRLSTVEHADQILVLDQGRVVDQGTHAELLTRGGLYAQLHRLQFDA